MKLLLLLAGLLMSVGAFAQPFSIDWHKVSGGGGTCTGGIYSLSATIGQHDAGNPLGTNSYVLTGGYWSLYAVQTPGAPALNILLTNGAAMVYWPSPSLGYNLQVNTNLSTPNWVAPTQIVTDNGTIKNIMVSSPAGQAYYRLFYH